MSARHREIARTRRFGAGVWWVELARAGAALLCILAYGLLAAAVTAVLSR